MAQYLEKIAAAPWSRIALAAILLSAMYIAVFYDNGGALDTQITLAKNQLNEASDKLIKTKTAVQNVKLFAQKVEAAEQQFLDIVGYMPSELNLGDFMQRVKDEAASAGASVASFSPNSDLDKKEFYEIRRFDLQLDGSFSQIVLFLSNLTKMPRLITFEKLNIRNNGGEIDNPRLKFKAVLNGYRYIKDIPTGTTPVKSTGPGGGK